MKQKNLKTEESRIVRIALNGRIPQNKSGRMARTGRTPHGSLGRTALKDRNPRKPSVLVGCRSQTLHLSDTLRDGKANGRHPW